MAEKRIPFPELSTEVMIRALTRCGSPEILRRSIAMTYGDAAPVPLPPTSPLSTAARVLSLYGMTIPIASEEEMKNSSIRQTKDLYAFGRTVRGISVSPATIEMYSGPVMENVA